jgi:hypothetical protein
MNKASTSPVIQTLGVVLQVFTVSTYDCDVISERILHSKTENKKILKYSASAQPAHVLSPTETLSFLLPKLL